MRKCTKLISLSALLVLVVLVSFCATKVMKGDFALGDTSTSTYTGATNTNFKHQLPTLQDSNGAGSSTSTSSPIQGYVSQTRDTEAIMLGVEIIPSFYYDEYTVSSTGTDVLSAKTALAAAGERYNSKKKYVYSYPVTDGMMLEGYDPTKVFGSDTEGSQFGDAVSRLIRDHGTYGMFTSEESIADIIYKELIGSEDNAEKIRAAYTGHSNYSLIEDIIDVNKDDVELFSGLSYTPFTLDSQNIERSFIYVPYEIGTTLKNTGRTYRGGMSGLLAQAYLRKGVLENKDIDLERDYTNLTVSGTWLDSVAGNSTTVTTIDGALEGIMGITAYKDFTVSKRQQLSEGYSALYPIVYTIKDDSGKYGGGYSVYIQNNITFPVWPTIGELRNGKVTNNKYVAGFSGASTDSDLITRTKESFKYFSNQSSVTGSFDSCNLYTNELNTDEKGIAALGEAAYNYYSKKHMEEAYAIVDYIFGSGKYNTGSRVNVSGYCWVIFGRAACDKIGGNKGPAQKYTDFMQLADINNAGGKNVSGDVLQSYKYMYGYVFDQDCKDKSAQDLVNMWNNASNEDKTKAYQFRQWQLQGAILAVASAHGMNEQYLNDCFYGFNIKYGEVGIYQHSYHSDPSNDDNDKAFGQKLYDKKHLITLLGENGAAFATTPANMAFIMAEAEDSNWKFTFADADLMEAGMYGSTAGINIKTLDSAGATDVNGHSVETITLGSGVLKTIRQLGCLYEEVSGEGGSFEIGVGLDYEYREVPGYYDIGAVYKPVSTGSGEKNQRGFNIGDLSRQYYMINLISRGKSYGYGMITRSDNTAAGTIVNYGLQLGGLWPFAITNTTKGKGYSSGWDGYIATPTKAYVEADLTGGEATTALIQGTKSDALLTPYYFKFSALKLQDNIGFQNTKFISGDSSRVGTIDYLVKEFTWAYRKFSDNAFWNQSLKTNTDGSKYYSPRRPGLAVEKAAAEDTGLGLAGNVFGLRTIFDKPTVKEQTHIDSDGRLYSGGSLKPNVTLQSYYSYKTWNTEIVQELYEISDITVNKSFKKLTDGIKTSTQTAAKANDAIRTNFASATGNIFFCQYLVTPPEKSGKTEVAGVLGFDNIQTKDNTNDVSHDIFEPKTSATEEEKPDLVFGINFAKESSVLSDLKQLVTWYEGGMKADEKPNIPTYYLYYNLVGSDATSGDGSTLWVQNKTVKASKFGRDWLTSEAGLNLKHFGELNNNLGDNKYFVAEGAGSGISVYDNGDSLFEITGKIRENDTYGIKANNSIYKEISSGGSLADLGIEGSKLRESSKTNTGTVISLNDQVIKLLEQGKTVFVEATLKANNLYDMEIQTWKYDQLFKGMFGDSESTNQLKYDTFYGIGMEYYVVKEVEETNKAKGKKDGSTKKYVATYKLGVDDKKANGSGANKTIWNALATTKGDIKQKTAITVAGTGFLNGIYRQTYYTRGVEAANANAVGILMYRAAENSKGVSAWPGYTRKDKAESYNNHMYFKVKRNLTFPIEESAVIIWDKTGTHDIDKTGGTVVGQPIPSNAHVDITAIFKSQADAEGKENESDDKVDVSDEYNAWKQSLKNLGITAITVYVYNDDSLFASACDEPCDSHDMCGVASVGTFECDSWTMSIDDFTKAVKPGSTYNMPVNMVSEAWQGINLHNCVTDPGEASNPGQACSSGTRVDYSVKIGYIGIVDGASLVASKNKNNCNKETCLTAALSSGKVCYDLLTGEKLSGSDYSLRELGYDGSDDSKENNNCWLHASGTTTVPNYDLRIIRSHLNADEIKAYATIKDGSYGDYTTVPTTQLYNVMSGVPSTEQIYFVTGGDEFIYELDLMLPDEQNAPERVARTYISSFAGRPCKFRDGDIAQAGGEGTGYTTQHQKKLINHAYNNESVEKTVYDTFVLPEPKNTGRRTDATWQAPEHGGVTITVTYKGEIKNTTSQPSVVLITSVADNLGVTSDTAAINVPRVTGNNKSEGGINVSPGSYYSGYAGEMDILNKQQLAGSAGGTYSWDVSNYNTDLQAAYEWAKAIEAGSDGAGNVVVYSDSDRAVRSWHAGDAEIQVTLSQLNWSSNYPGLNGNLNSEALVNQAHAAENFKNSSHKWTTETVMQENKNSGAVLVSNDDALSSGWFEVFGSADIYGGMSGCKPEAGTSSSTVTRHSTGQPTKTIVASYTHGNGDEVSWLDWLKDGNPKDATYTYVDTYEDGHDTSAQPDGSCSDSCSPHTAEFTAWESTWCGKPAETHKDAVHKHTTKTTTVKGSTSCDAGCTCGAPGNDPENPYECTCSHTHYSCTHSVTAGSYTTHTCSQSHSHGGYSVTKLAKADTVKYTITVTFKNTFTRNDSDGTDAESSGEKNCSGGNYPAHSLCGPCCQHTLPTITDNWVQYFNYKYVSIEDISVFKIGRSTVKGINKVTYDYDAAEYEYLLGTITRGDPNIWYNIADFNYGYHNINVNGLRQQASAAGRIRYDLQSQQLDEVVWVEENDEGISVPGSYKYCRTGDCDGQDGTKTTYNPVIVKDKGHELTFSKGMMYARTIDSSAIKKGANVYNNKTGLKSTGSDISYTVDNKTMYLRSILGSDMQGAITTDGALFYGRIAMVSTTIADATDSDLSGKYRKWFYYTGEDAHPEIFTNVEDWIDSITTGGVKQEYDSDWIDDKDSTTLEYKRFKERRKEKVSATICSDMLILQTSTGDLPIVYGEKKSPTVTTEQNVDVDSTIIVGWREAVESHARTVQDEETNTYYQGYDRVGGYNGRGNLGGSDYPTYQHSIFTSSGAKSFYCSLDTGTNEDVDVSVKHTADKCNNGSTYMTPRITFQSVSTAVDDNDGKYHKSSPVLHQNRMPITSYLKIGKNSMQLNPLLENGWYKADIAEQTWNHIFEWYDADDRARLWPKANPKPIPIDKLFKKSDNNNVNKSGEAKRKVFTKEAVYYQGATKVNDIIIHTPISNTYTYLNNYDGPIEDQRIIAKNTVTSTNEYCPGTASLCSHSVLDCTYYRDNVVLSLNFEPQNTMQVRDIDGNLTSATIDTVSVGADGFTRVTDLINRLKISLPASAQIVGSAGYSKVMLTSSAGASGTFGVKLGDIYCTPTTGLRVKASFEYKSDGGSNTLMSIGKFRAYVKAGEANYLYTTDGTNTMRYTISGINGSTKNISIVMIPDGLSSCQVYVGSTAMAGTTVGTYTTKSISVADMGTYISFGGADNTSASYYDNVVVTRLAGTSTHTAACYETVINHEKTEQYNCQQPVAILAGTEGAQAFTAPVSGIYTIECYGAQGGGVDMNSTSVATGNAGGLGGYTKADVYLQKGQTIYAYVGKQGKAANGSVNAGGGWNGGGNASGSGYGGGGMTYISYSGTDTQGVLSSTSVSTITPISNPTKSSYTTGSGSVSLTPGIYKLEAYASDGKGTTGWLEITNGNKTLYYGTGSTAFISDSNSYSNSLVGAVAGSSGVATLTTATNASNSNGQNYSVGNYSSSKDLLDDGQNGVYYYSGTDGSSYTGYHAGTAYAMNNSYWGWSTVASGGVNAGGCRYYSGTNTKNVSATADGAVYVFNARTGFSTQYGQFTNLYFAFSGTGVSNTSLITLNQAKANGYISACYAYSPGGSYTAIPNVVNVLDGGYCGQGSWSNLYVAFKCNPGVKVTQVSIYCYRQSAPGDGMSLIQYTGTSVAAQYTYRNGAVTDPKTAVAGTAGAYITKYVDLSSVPASASISYDIVDTLEERTFTKDFAYTGGVQSISLQPGTYTFEVWGAQGGGSTSNTSFGNKGSYAKGTYTVSATQTLYVIVGGRGGNGNGSIDSSGGHSGSPGYNGGGSCTGGGAYGGGMTHISTTQNVASYNANWSSAGTIIVAGGGGGNSASATDLGVAQGAYQGRGENGCSSRHNSSYANDESGGGGGWYGGAVQHGDDPRNSYSGTSYVGGVTGGTTQNSIWTGNGKARITGTEMVGSTSVSNVTVTRKTGGTGTFDVNSVIAVAGGGGGAGYNASTSAGAANDYSGGDGGERAQLIHEFNYTGSVQEVTLQPGTYVLEAYGAAGGNGPSNNGLAGKGGYTTGTVTLDKVTTLYVYVGQQGNGAVHGQYGLATFNGGGAGWRQGGVNIATHNGTSGGGATDFRLVGGAWNDAAGLRSRILVAGGGGGYGCASNHNPGHGGGLVGAATVNKAGGSYAGASASGGSQTAGGTGVGAYKTSGSSSGGFGYGADGTQCAAGGGGGYYGGGSEYTAGGGGGSSYVSGYAGCDTTYLANQKVNGHNLTFTNVALQQGINGGNGIARIYQLNGSGTGGKYSTQISDGYTWVKVFYHDSANGGLFANAEEALHTGSPDSFKYSILDELSTLKSTSDSKYVFMLYYPETGEKILWKQSKAPQSEAETSGDGSRAAEGYQLINSNTTLGCYWGGLVKSSSGVTLIDGSTYHGNWYYAIGSYSYWSGVDTIPGTSPAIHKVELWLATDPSKVTGGTGSASSNINMYGKVGGVTDISNVRNISDTGTLYKEFDYTGAVQSITLPAGTYRLEAYGAQAGMYSSGYAGGLGGYTAGTITLSKSTTLYVYVGQQGASYSANYSTGVGFNGGGKGYGGGGDGGGATDFRLTGGSWDADDGLKSRLLVAGGGGGSDLNSKGGGGGGLAGESGMFPQGSAAGTGGTQKSGGVNASNASVNGRFGYGGGHQWNSASDSGGGGGGWYGGAAGWGGHDGGGGGSSYVSGYAGCDTTHLANQKVNGKTASFTDVVFEQGVHTGNGLARIYKVSSFDIVAGASSTLGGNAGGGGGGWYGGGTHNVGQTVEAIRITDSRGTSYDAATGFTTITGTSAHCCISDYVTPGLRYVRVTVYGEGLSGKISGMSPCNNYGQTVISSTITDTKAEFIIDKTEAGKGNALSMGFGWLVVGAKLSSYTIEGSPSKTFAIAANGGGGNGGGSAVNSSYIVNGSLSYENGVNYGDGKVVITLGTHNHTAACSKTNPDYNTHTHSASCICGTDQALTALRRAVENAKHNNDWTDLCKYLGKATKSELKNIKNGSANVYDTIMNGTDTMSTVTSVVNIVKAQPTSWIAAVCKLGTANNPIISCGNIYTTHVCSSKCSTTTVFKCNEPHHDGGHYGRGNEICWEACHNDANHIETNGMAGVGQHMIADRLQIDDYFSLHWDNRGNFYDANGETSYYTSSTLNSTRGQSFFTQHSPSSTIDTTRWIRAKVIVFYDIDVILYNEHTGEWEFHERNKPFYLPIVTDGVVGNGNDDVLQRQTAGGGVRDEWKARQGSWSSLHAITDYNFYLLLENNEFDDTRYKVWTIAINDENTSATKNMPYNIASDIVSNENNKNTNKVRTGPAGDYKSFETCTNEETFDVAGSIGNLLITSTTDFRFSNFFKQSTSEWEVEPFIHKVDESVQSKYLGIGIRNGALMDVRFRPISKATHMYNTWLVSPYASSDLDPEYWTETATLYNMVGGDVYSIITADIRSTYATEDTELVMGYKFFTEITTIGDYTRLEVDEHYYLLDKETGQILDCDVWTKSSDGYKATYIARISDSANGAIQGGDMSSLTGNVFSLIRGEQFEVNKQTLSLNVEAAARQVLKAEIENTQRIDNGGVGFDDEGNKLNAVENGLTVTEVLQYIGDIRTLSLGRTARTYIGTSCPNIIYSAKYNPKGSFNGLLTTNVGGAISEDMFAKQAKRWLFTLGLPETAYIVPFGPDYEGGKHLNPNVAMSDGRDPISDLLYDAEGKGKERYVVLVGVDIRAYGPIWSVEYEAYQQPQVIRIGGKSYTLPTSVPDILAVMDLNNVPDTDWDIIKTH